ncbi:hypothetical protein GBF38_011472 [Nibea albiflora]|uniref:Uncharacterized protein n=1 Tax=Nibea albiflora TaxID=240163 RepID=A0ACB7F3L9_NIBAL|nr:hypothetical protein GBF38_011472 [Nibea albiflora]
MQLAVPLAEHWGRVGATLLPQGGDFQCEILLVEWAQKAESHKRSNQTQQPPSPRPDTATMTNGGQSDDRKYDSMLSMPQLPSLLRCPEAKTNKGITPPHTRAHLGAYILYVLMKVDSVNWIEAEHSPVLVFDQILAISARPSSSTFVQIMKWKHANTLN